MIEDKQLASVSVNLHEVIIVKTQLINWFGVCSFLFRSQQTYLSLMNEYSDWNNSAANLRSQIDEMLADTLLNAPALNSAMMHSTSGSGRSTYLYQLDTGSGRLAMTTNVQQLPYILGQPLTPALDLTGSGRLHNFSVDQVKLCEQLITYWVNFARTGDPNNAHFSSTSSSSSAASASSSSSLSMQNVHYWPQFEPTRQVFLRFGDRHTQIAQHFRAHQMSLHLQMLPKLQNFGQNWSPEHHQLVDHHNSNTFEGSVRDWSDHLHAPTISSAGNAWHKDTSAANHRVYSNLIAGSAPPSLNNLNDWLNSASDAITSGRAFSANQTNHTLIQLLQTLNKTATADQQVLLQSLINVLLAGSQHSLPSAASKVNSQGVSRQMAEQRLMLPLSNQKQATTGNSNVLNGQPMTGSELLQHSPGSLNDSIQLVLNESQGGYSTALSVTIIVGCSLLALNVLVFAGVFLNRDATSGSSRVRAVQRNVNAAATQPTTSNGLDNSKACYASNTTTTANQSALYLQCDGCNDLHSNAAQLASLANSANSAPCPATILTLKQHPDGKTYVTNTSSGSPGKGADLLTQFAYATMLPLTNAHHPPIPSSQASQLPVNSAQMHHSSIGSNNNMTSTSVSSATQHHAQHIYLPMEGVQLELNGSGVDANSLTISGRQTCELVPCDLQCDCGCSSPFACPSAGQTIGISGHCVTSNGDSNQSFVN